MAPCERPGGLDDDMTWVRGDPTRESELSKVRIDQAAAVVLVGSREIPPQVADANTILTAFTIRSYLAKSPGAQGRPRVYIVAEILDAENVSHARAAGADEVIETTLLGFSLLSHSVAVHGSGAILGRVLSSEASSLYVGRLPSPDFSGSFEEVSRVCKARRALVIGVRDPRTGEDRLNPPEALHVSSPLQLLYLAEAAVLEGVEEPKSGESGG